MNAPTPPDPRGAATPGPTPGPWRWECAENTKTITLKGGSRASAFGRYDMAVMTFRRWGMSGAQPHVLDTNDRGILCPMNVFAVEAPGREHHAAWFKLIDHPDARLIEQAWTIPALRDALAVAEAALDELLDYSGGADHALADEYVVERAREALDKARAARLALASAEGGVA